jgi:hypothetical protein
MDSTKTSIVQRIIRRRKKYDPAGLKNAIHKNTLKQYLEFELQRAGLDDDSIMKAFQEDEFMNILRKTTLQDLQSIDLQSLVQNFSFYELEDLLDENIFEPLYDKELGNELDGKMQERMLILGFDIFGDKSKEVKRKLIFPKLALFAMSVATGIYALGSWFYGSKLASLLNAWATHDLFRMSWNCYAKVYLLKGARAYKARTGLGSLIYDTVSSAITGKQPQTDKFLREVSTDILLDGTYCSDVRYWYLKREARKMD